MTTEERMVLAIRVIELDSTRRMVVKKIPEMTQKYLRDMEGALEINNFRLAEHVFVMMSKMLKKRRMLLSGLATRIKTINRQLEQE